MTKIYDRAYFQRWYHNRRTRVNTAADVRRKAGLAVATAEYFLHRQVKTVLDIGCGEGAWLPHLRALRPGIVYSGLDPSEYAVERFGEARNLRKASFADLPSLGLMTHDLVICSDVMHYVIDEDEIRAGAAEIARICEGVAYIEVLTREDDIIGDLDGLIRRPASWYRRVLGKTGLTQVGPYLWLSPELGDMAAELERP
jgi:SAM-dependent methyltransferase